MNFIKSVKEKSPGAILDLAAAPYLQALVDQKWDFDVVLKRPSIKNIFLSRYRGMMWGGKKPIECLSHEDKMHYFTCAKKFTNRKDEIIELCKIMYTIDILVTKYAEAEG